MKKSLVFLMVMCLVAMLSAQADAQPVKNGVEGAQYSIPDYHKLDPALVSELRASGIAVKGKDFIANGKAYIKPPAGQPVKAKDMRTMDAKGIAILVDFPANEDGSSAVPGVDYPQVPAEKFDDLLNGTEYNPYDLALFSWLAEYNGIPAPIDRTLRNYYHEVSYGQFQIDVDVVGWYELPHTYDYYMNQDYAYYNANGDAHMYDLVWDAIQLADEDVDFSQYAVNGEVPNIFIIHRGTGAEYSTDPSIIWSHQWSILGAAYWGYYFQTGNEMTDEEIVDQIQSQMVDGVLVNEYNIVPEVGQDISGSLAIYHPGIVPPGYEGRDPSPAYPGVYAHEFGHVLGLPDQYDYGYESEGTGMFTLMAGGSYGRNFPDRWYNGNTPVHMNAWDKFYLGFANPIEVSENQSLTLRPVTQAPDIYKIVVPGSQGREYFLLENRQQEKFDAGLSYNVDGELLHGLVVYHIVDDMIMRNFNRPNEAQNWDLNHLGKGQQGTSQYGQTHYGFSVIQADGMFNLEKGQNDGDAGDVFPGKFNITSLVSNKLAAPNTTSVFKWTTKHTETGINLVNIEEDEDGTITLDVVFK